MLGAALQPRSPAVDSVKVHIPRFIIHVAPAPVASGDNFHGRTFRFRSQKVREGLYLPVPTLPSVLSKTRLWSIGQLRAILLTPHSWGYPATKCGLGVTFMS